MMYTKTTLQVHIREVWTDETKKQKNIQQNWIVVLYALTPVIPKVKRIHTVGIVIKV